MTAFPIDRVPTPAASKIPEICTPECAGTERETGTPRRFLSASKIVKVTCAVTSSGLKTPTFVRNPVGGVVPGLCRIEVSTETEYALDAGSPGMNIPTEFNGEVENRR